MTTPAHRAAAYLAWMVLANDERAKAYAAEILETPEFAAVDTTHLETKPKETES